MSRAVLKIHENKLKGEFFFILLTDSEASEVKTNNNSCHVWAGSTEMRKRVFCWLFQFSLLFFPHPPPEGGVASFVYFSPEASPDPHIGIPRQSPR